MAWATPGREARRSLSRWFWRLLPLAQIVIAGGLIAAPALVPSWEFYRLSGRFGRPVLTEGMSLAGGWGHALADFPVGLGGLLIILVGTALFFRRDRTTWGLVAVAALALG